MNDKPLIFDIHLDLSMNAMSWNRDLRWSQEKIQRWEHIQGLTKDGAGEVDRGNNTVCFPEMRRGNIGLCVGTFIGRYSSYFHRLPGWNSPEQAWASTRAQLAWYRCMEDDGELTPITTVAALEAHEKLWLDSPHPDDGTPYVVESKKQPTKLPIGYVMSLEGADCLVKLSYLETMYQDGLRALGPAHYGPGRYANGTDDCGRLREEGKELLKEMDRLGIILDVTHLCDETFWDSLDCFEGPLWASHQNCRTLAPWNRQFADDQIKAVVDRGGLLGSAFDAIMMVPGWRHLRSTPEGFQLRIERICEHIDHVCQIAGSAKHICIGTDLDGGYGTEQTPMDMKSIADLQTIPGLLAERGYSKEDIDGFMWKNVVDFLKRAWS